VVATLHLEGGGIIFVTVGFVKAGGGGVIAVLAEAMRPTIIHFAALNSGMLCRGWWSRGRYDGSGRRGRRRSCSYSLVCAMEARSAGSELPNKLLLVAKLKLDLEEGKSPIGERAKAEFLGCGSQQTGGFKHC
jgi:hypothetical protein